MQDAKRRKDERDHVKKHVDPFGFTAQAKDFVAIYCDLEEDQVPPRRFWVGQAGEDIECTADKEKSFKIYYFTSEDEEYTSFVVEGKRRRPTYLPYKSLMGTIHGKVVDSGKKFVICVEERDRQTARGCKLDAESSNM